MMRGRAQSLIALHQSSCCNAGKEAFMCWSATTLQYLPLGDAGGREDSDSGRTGGTPLPSNL